DDQRGQRFGQHVLERPAFRQQDLGDAVELGGSLRHRATTAPGNQHMHVGAERFRGGQRLVGRILERLVVVFGGQEDCPHSTPASFLSLATSSATDPTLTPDLRVGGSLVLTISSRGFTSTP